MDSFEWNKIFGALLAAAFVVLGLNFGSDMLFSSHHAEKAGYALEGGPVETAAGGDANKGPEIEDVLPMLAKMEAAQGQKVAKKCVACHVFEKGGKNKVGPALYDVVNRQIAAGDGFAYSPALTEFGQGKVWDYDTLNKFLFKPKALVNKTSMKFVGLKKVGDRAAIIAYLRSLSDSPAAMPDVAAETSSESTTETATESN